MAAIEFTELNIPEVTFPINPKGECRPPYSHQKTTFQMSDSLALSVYGRQEGAARLASSTLCGGMSSPVGRITFFCRPTKAKRASPHTLKAAATPDGVWTQGVAKGLQTIVTLYQNPDAVCLRQSIPKMPKTLRSFLAARAVAAAVALALPTTHPT
jgi:hypothetical protein